MTTTPFAARPDRLVVMDVDSTLITGEVIEMLAGHAGSRDEVAAITDRAMRGELDFAASLRSRVATLAGLPVRVLGEVLGEVELTPGARELVAGLRERGWPLGLVSGGFIEVVGPLAERLGIERRRANRLEVAGGYLTGRLVGAVVDRAAKAAATRGPSPTTVGCGGAADHPGHASSATLAGLPLDTPVSSRSACRMSRAWRTAPRSTPNSSASSAWVGMRCPGRSTPDPIRLRSSSAISRWDARDARGSLTEACSGSTGKPYNFPPTCGSSVTAGYETPSNGDK